MKLICIKDTNVEMDNKFIELLSKVSSEINRPTHDLLPKLGKEYTLVNVVYGLTLFGTHNNIWYRLEETGELIHHSSLFAILPSSWRDTKISNLIGD